MTRPSSNYAGQYFCWLLEKMKTCIILAIIFSFCGFPVMSVSQAFNLEAEAVLLLLSVLGVGGITVLCFITPLICMKHLHTRTAADNILSLPLTTRQRFFCETGASILSVLVPYAASLPLTLLLDVTTKGSLTSRYVVASSSGIGMTVSDLALFMPFVLLMLLALNIFLITFCGRRSEAILYLIAANILLPLVFMLATMLYYANGFGMEMMLTAGSYLLMECTSPFGAAIGFMLLDSYSDVLGQIILIALLYTAVLLPLAYLSYSRRPVPNIGQPFVYRRAYGINSALIAAFCVLCYFAVHVISRQNITPVSIIVLAVMLLILCLIMEFICFKKIRSMPKFLLRYVGTFAAGGLAAYVLFSCGGLGLVEYIPEAEEIDYIWVDACAHGNAYDHTSYVEMLVKGDSELCELVRAEQKRIIDERSEGYTGMLRLTYDLKNGKEVYRYYGSCDLSEDFLQKLLESEDYKFDSMRQAERFESKNPYPPDMITDRYGFRLTSPYSDRRYVSGSGIDAENIEKLKAALTEDLKNDACYDRHTEPPIGSLLVGRELLNGPNSESVIISGSGARYTIYESYTNTIAYLSGYGKVPTAREAIEDLAKQGTPLLLIRSRKREYDQTAFIRRYSDGGDGESAVFLTAEEFAEAASYQANYIYTEGQDCEYYLCVGIPYFFNEDWVLKEEIQKELEEEGMLGLFRYREDRGGYIYEYQSPYESGQTTFLLNEECYDLLDQYFSEKHVYHDPNA